VLAHEQGMAAQHIVRLVQCHTCPASPSCAGTASAPGCNSSPLDCGFFQFCISQVCAALAVLSPVFGALVAPGTSPASTKAAHMLAVLISGGPGSLVCHLHTGSPCTLIHVGALFSVTHSTSCALVLLLPCSSVLRQLLRAPTPELPPMACCACHNPSSATHVLMVHVCRPHAPRTAPMLRTAARSSPTADSQASATAMVGCA
jgi:hypothetical protein